MKTAKYKYMIWHDYAQHEYYVQCLSCKHIMVSHTSKHGKMAEPFEVRYCAHCGAKFEVIADENGRV